MPPRKKKEYTPEEKAEIVKRLREGKEKARLAREAKKNDENKKVEKVKLPEPPLDVKVPDLKQEAKEEIAKPKRAPKTAKIPKEEEQKIEIVNTPPPPPPPPPPPIPEESDEEDGEYVPLDLPEPPPEPPKLKRNERMIKQPSAEELEPQFRPAPRRRPQLPPEVLQAKQRQAQIQQRKLTTLDIAYSSLF